MRVLLLFLVLTMAPGALAQVGASRVDAIGQHTLYAPPTHVEFWLFYTARDANLELAMQDAEEFEERLRERLQGENLRPSTIELGAPALPDVRENRVEMAAFMRFSMAAYFHPQTGARDFARLCDQVRSIADELEAEITGPVLDTTERHTLVQRALTAAIEDAYPAAEAIARAIEGRVSAVESVEVLDILWNQPLEYHGVTPSVRQLALTARVRVSYTITTDD